MASTPSALPLAVGQVPAEQRCTLPRVRPSLAEPLRPAPDFVAPAYTGGGSSEQVRLSDFRGEWLVLHFYIGDHTYV